jgi:hypothetical protein
MQSDTIHDRAHAEFAHTVIDMITRLMTTNGNAFFPVSQVRTGQISRTAEEFWQRWGKCLNRILTRFTRRDVFFFSTQAAIAFATTSSKFAGKSPFIRRVSSAAFCGNFAL